MGSSGRGDLYERYGPRRSQGARFEASSVADLYRYRPPYSDEVFELLEGLVRDRTRLVLDAGAGPGKIARELVARSLRVDAVDASAEMIRVGRTLTNGDHPSLRWIHGAIEQAPLTPGYGLAVAGASFHWFDANRVLARLREVLHPEALLAVIDGDGAWKAPWAEAEQAVMIEFVARMEGKRPEWRKVDLGEIRLLEHARFELQGHRVTAPAPFRQRVDDYIACQHSRATFTLPVMGPELARQFDNALREALKPHADSGWVTFDRRTRIEWGRPREDPT
jgi:SAM-dependent methyltransferase